MKYLRILILFLLIQQALPFTVQGLNLPACDDSNNACVMTSPVVECYTPCSCCLYEPIRGYLSHTEGRGLGYNKGYTTAGIFAAFPTQYQCNTYYPFVDAKFHFFNDSKAATSIGTGLRYLSPSCWIFGGNIYYDFREGRFGGHHQIGIGFEALGPCVDFRLNGVFAIGRRTQHSRLHVYDDYIGNYWATCQQFEKALSGLNAEVGFPLLRRPENCYEIYLAAGPYYYSQNIHKKSIFGGLLRLQAIYSYFTLALIGTYDHVNKARGQVQLTVNFPFKWNCSPSCRGRKTYLYQPVQRQDIIYLDCDCCWDWNW